MPDVVALEVHQNDLLSIHYGYAQKLSMVSGYTEDVKKNKHKIVKIGGWAVAWDITVMWHYSIV